MDNINIQDLKSGIAIKFTTSKGTTAIGKITSIDMDRNTILMHDMILLGDFSKLRGRFGGLIIGFSQIISII